MDIQALRLEGGEAVGDREKLPAHRGQMVEAFPEPEVGEIIGADLIASNRRGRCDVRARVARVWCGAYP